MPDHPFELLGDQRFQEFSQALLVLAFPNAQCLPVAQPDGGRDALLRGRGGELLVFQVKFARSPKRLIDPGRWVEEALDGEREKIERLVERGATSYKLITNLSATAHLDSGSLDKVQAVLGDLEIPADCWWRDDLNRRLEGAFDLKFAYPELFVGNDMIRSLVERKERGEEWQRRQNAITAYLGKQCDDDRDVRFKQADLVNDLFKLFIDVPAAPVQRPGRDLAVGDAEELDVQIAGWAERFAAGLPVGPRPAAGLLLGGTFQEAAPRVVVEGAPGQGKSTMLQYACQVHRLRALGREIDSDVPSAHLEGPVRLPFRVDLQDFSDWLVRQRGLAGPDAPPSLERFLAQSVEDASGGARFDVADLQAVAREANLLLALDGLDEVGDRERREFVVEAIEEAVTRLEAVAPLCQTVVTSRPSLFVGAARLPGTFDVLRLQSVERPLIRVYTGKWMDARRLSDRDRTELTDTLDKKLDEPHFRDIAQNPMQLAILLYLVNRRGEALPDQRTRLYLSYMEPFLDREAGKSEAVNKHRELLMTLHGYLAWLLHSRTEKEGVVGRFTVDEISTAAGDYLEGKGFERDLFGDLFTGVFDRVGALVSRYEGTFEFEVQQVREFFAAFYLYETAPQSAAGDVRSGARPERFDAIARRPFWLNVTRFYAGFYGTGELASLAERLELLHDDPRWIGTSHPRDVALCLLADRTFQQNRHIQERVAARVGADLGARGYSPSLNAECGGDVLADCAWRQLLEESHGDRRRVLAYTINELMEDHCRRSERWLDEARALEPGPTLRRWYRSARELGLSEVLEAGDVNFAAGVDDADVAALLAGGQFRAFDGIPQAEVAALRQVLEVSDLPRRGVPGLHPLSALADLLRLDKTLSALRRRALGIAKLADYDSFTDENVKRFVARGGEVVGDWATDWGRTQPWDRLVEEGRELLGDCPGFTDLAISHTGLPGSLGRESRFAELFDPTLSLCARTRHARFRAGDSRWWRDRLLEAGSEHERVMVLALAWCWAPEQTLEVVHEELVAIEAELAAASRGRLVRVVSRTMSGVARELRLGLRTTRWLGEPSALSFVCASPRMPQAVANGLYRRSGRFEGETDPAVIDALARFDLTAHRNVEEEVALVKCRMENADWALSGELTRLVSFEPARMPTELAEQMVANVADYPLAFVPMAESRCMAAAEKNLIGVGAVADEENWFDQPE